jgi:CPA2 family monovalent cation:H+ antiporter-2
VENRRLGNRETRAILGIAVIEDIFLAFYLAMLQPVLGGADGVQQALVGIGTAFGFLVLLGALARSGAALVVRLVSTHDEEIVVVVFVGMAIITAGMAEALGVSDAIGAFMVGLILGATAKAARLRALTHPLRDAFGAIFFFHFGLTIDPVEVVGVLPQVAVAVVMTVLLATAAGVVAARMHGFDRVEAANIGYTVLTRGEFSIILASLAVAAGLDHRISSLAAGYVLVLAIVGPVAAVHSEWFSRLIPARLFPRGGRRPDSIPLDLDVGTGSLYRRGAELLQITVRPGSRLHGVHVFELRLPLGSTLALLARDGRTHSVQPTTQLRTGDVLLVFTHPQQRAAAEKRVLAVHREGRLAHWRDDVGD